MRHLAAIMAFVSTCWLLADGAAAAPGFVARGVVHVYATEPTFAPRGEAPDLEPRTLFEVARSIGTLGPPLDGPAPWAEALDRTLAEQKPTLAGLTVGAAAPAAVAVPAVGSAARGLALICLVAVVAMVLVGHSVRRLRPLRVG